MRELWEEDGWKFWNVKKYLEWRQRVTEVISMKRIWKKHLKQKIFLGWKGSVKEENKRRRTKHLGWSKDLG